MASLRLAPSRVDDLPRLAWLARHRKGERDVEVLHGPWVEVGSGWIVEGVWPGRFEDGGFHASPGFFGTGVRVDGDRLWLVPSRGLVDRVVWVHVPPTLVASNSLPLLLSALGARLDPDANHRVASSARSKGIDAYPDAIPVVHPRLASVRQRLYDPLVWRDGEGRRPGRPPIRGFSGYDDYTGTLREDVAALLRNARSLGRSRPMLAFSAASRGYDSPAVTALAAEHGLDGAFAGSAPLHSLLYGLGDLFAPDDSGAEICSHLGVPVEVSGVRLSLTPSDEPYYYASGALTDELMLSPFCDRIGRGDTPAVLLTGYRGDLIWEADLEESLRTPDLKTGLCDLSEIRLAAGFVNAPVPVLHARAVSDILRISRSEEMAPWRLGTDYDRPIPRRLLEEAGVPREAFGQEKRAAERRERWPRTPGPRRDFLRYLAGRHGWPAPLARAIGWWNDLVRSLASRASTVGEAVGMDLSARRLRKALGYVDLEHELHVWSVNHLIERFEGSLPERGAAGS